jgi:ATP-dependent DNA helicase PIF1
MFSKNHKLTKCQKKGLEILKGKKNVFLTGAAGSGKSFLIHKFLENKDRNDFPIVASTGAAAIIVGGITFHSFFGLGIMQGGYEETILRALRNRKLKNRLKNDI